MMKVENIYEITALSRSGHHAIINWMGKNLTGEIFPEFGSLGYSKFKDIGNYTLHINQADCDSHLIKKYLNDNLRQLEHLFISYENKKYDFSLFSKELKYKSPTIFECDYLERPQNRKKIIIIRDFYNNLASRIK